MTNDDVITGFLLTRFYFLCSNGMDALAKLQSAIGGSIPDLVLSDVMMPHLDGFGLLKAIRGNAFTFLGIF